jgi:hypothetical protein
MISDFLFVGAIASIYLCLILRPRWYLYALFFAAPWMGMVVRIGWMLEPFKIGLLLSPALYLGLRVSRRVAAPLKPIACLLAWAAALFIWQSLSREIVAFDVLRSDVLSTRLEVANVMFFLRLALFGLVLCYIDAATVPRCMALYVGAVSLLAFYGAIQEISFITLGDPITYALSDSHSLIRTSGANFSGTLFGISILRINSFFGEPKDLAFFVMPALAFVFAKARIPDPRLQERAWVTKAQMGLLTIVGIMSFSSSFLIVLPVLFVTLLALEPRMRGRRKRVLLSIAVCLCCIPLFGAIWQIRVRERFGSPIEFLQESRERPAWGFFLDKFPRSLLGLGVGTQAYYLPGLMGAEFQNSVAKVDAAAGMDSFLLSLLLDLGVPGALFFLWLCWKIIRGDRARTPENWPYTAAAIGAILISVPLQGDLRSGTLWLLLALAWVRQRAVRPAMPGAIGRYRLEGRRVTPSRGRRQLVPMAQRELRNDA